MADLDDVARAGDVDLLDGWVLLQPDIDKRREVEDRVRAAKGRAEVLLRPDVAGCRRDRDPSLLALLFRLGVFDVGRTIQDVHVIEAGPFARRLERAIPSAEHRDEALPEEAGASNHDSLSRAVWNVGAAFVLRFVHENSSGKPLAGGR